MATLTNEERAKREAVIKELLSEGKSTGEIGRALGVSQQSVHKFITLRGWKTACMPGSPQDIERQARIEKRRAMPPSGIDRSGAVRDKG